MPICCAGVEGAAAQGHTGEASTLGRGEATQPSGSTAVAHRAAGADTFAATQTHGGEDDGGRRCLEMFGDDGAGMSSCSSCGLGDGIQALLDFNSAGEFGGGETGAQSRKGGQGGVSHFRPFSWR